MATRLALAGVAVGSLLLAVFAVGALALAVLAWVLFLPLVFGEPPAVGLVNRAADLAMGAWIAAFALTPSPGSGNGTAAVTV